MVEQIWRSVFGNLTLIEISALFTGLSFSWDRISALLARKKEEKALAVESSLYSAVINTAREAGTHLSGANEISKEKGDELLDTATETAIEISKGRGINLEKTLGGYENAKRATQTAFKTAKQFFAKD